MMKDENSDLMSSGSEFVERWKGYFENLMNVGNFREEREDSGEIQDWEIIPITWEEIERAFSRMKNCKTVGPDEIPAEAWKNLGVCGNEFITCLFNNILDTEQIPEEWNRSTLVTTYKNKGDV